jgi:ribonuclease Z
VDLDLVFLGTSGSVPTARRAPSSLLLRRGGERLLFDCGEGTQRQLLRSSIGLVDVDEVFLTHFHADHTLGLPGLMKTFALRGREAALTVHGPAGLEDFFRSLARIFGKLTYPYRLVELRAGERLDRGDHAIEAVRVDHGTPAIGYRLVEDERPGRFDVEAAGRLGVPSGPLFGALQRGEEVTLPDGTTVRPDEVLGEARRGRRVVLTGDTRPARSVLEAALDADLLVHDGTFLAEDAERAAETGHSTARDAAEVARAAGARMLALTHLSNRYFGPEVVREARAVFPATVVPRDFDIIAIPFPERGEPRLVKGGALGRQEEAEAGEHGAGGGGGEPHGGGGDRDDPQGGGDPVGAPSGRGAPPDAA